jgi:hypothetical protein
MPVNSGFSPIPPQSSLPPPDASPELLHRHFLRQAALANWNTYRLMVLIRRMAACEGYEKYGCVTLAQYLSLVCGITGVAARERIRVALALAELKAIEEAFAKGKLSYSKVRAVTRVATETSEREWLRAALERTAEELEVMVARSQRGKPMTRRLLTRALDQHTTRMVVDLPVEEMELIAQALEAVRRAAGGKLAASEALVYLAADSLAGEPQSISTAERYTVIVHADKEGTAWVETESGPAPLRPAVVERLLCDCTMRLAREEGDGSFVLSRRQRTIPWVTRRAVEVRDRKRCRVPGCNRTLWLDTHHMELWAEGGKHSRRNLLLLCTQHHQLCHDGLLIVEMDEAGKFRFRAADDWRLGEDAELEVWGVPADWEEREKEMAEAAGEEEHPAHDPEEGRMNLSTGLECGRPRRSPWVTLFDKPRVAYRADRDVSAETWRGKLRRPAAKCFSGNISSASREPISLPIPYGTLPRHAPPNDRGFLAPAVAG